MFGVALNPALELGLYLSPTLGDCRLLNLRPRRHWRRRMDATAEEVVASAGRNHRNQYQSERPDQRKIS